jgi:hypothetical protein
MIKKPVLSFMNIQKIVMITLVVLMSISSIPLNTSADENTQHSMYDLLIICPDTFEDLLNPLVNHKNEMGMKTNLVTLSTVYDQMYWLGRDNPEKIKYFIKHAYDHWNIHYVLLVGDFKKMPIRYVYNNEPWEGYYEPRYISELYYADLYDSTGQFSDWNSNNNDLFGEWTGSEAQDKDIDLYPDVAIGRLACRNKGEVKTMVRKIIHYETHTYNQDWFNRFVVVAGDTYPPGDYPFDTTPIEGEENTLRAIENMSGFDPVKLWVSTGAFTGPLDVIKTMNKGCGFMFFDGHASPIAWGTHQAYAEEDDPLIWGLKNYHMNFLMNGYKLPIVVAPACHNGQFDIQPIKLLHRFLGEPINYGEWGLECWAWKLASNPFGGSIATISNTGLGMSKEDKQSMEGAGDFMDPQFFVEYGNERHEYLGDVWMQSVSNYIDAFPVDWDQPEGSDAAIDAKTPQEWTLLGDPSLRIGGYP